MKNDTYNFGKQFIFGAATAAYQIEGARNEDGKSDSIWDSFSHKKGTILNNDNGDVACDHYHLYKDDVALMKKIGINSYRFSISWTRVIPDGDGAVNRKGLDFYKRLTALLIENGITPFATLFHWDLPLSLQKLYGGFTNQKCIDAFCRYTEKTVSALRGTVKNWITINEPWEFSCFGHLIGKHAPGTHSFGDYFKVMHNTLLSHGKAVPIIKSIDDKLKVGIAISMTPIHPSSEKERDRRAALLANQFMNHVTLKPLYHGEYPKELWKNGFLFRPKITGEQMRIISTPIDFLGLNYYSREHASYNPFIPVIRANISGEKVPERQYVDAEGRQRTSMGWEIYPEGLSECLSLIRDSYGNPPVYITETGAAFDDEVSGDGKVHDSLRVDFLRKYFHESEKAIKRGSDLRGIFVWSLLDNFEWAAGRAKRFGLIYVDYATQKRIIKDSGIWYRDLIRNQEK
jgi:beta-glucosidase